MTEFHDESVEMFHDESVEMFHDIVLNEASCKDCDEEIIHKTLVINDDLIAMHRFLNKLGKMGDRLSLDAENESSWIRFYGCYAHDYDKSLHLQVKRGKDGQKDEWLHVRPARLKAYANINDPRLDFVVLRNMGGPTSDVIGLYESASEPCEGNNWIIRLSGGCIVMHPKGSHYMSNGNALYKVFELHSFY